MKTLLVNTNRKFKNGPIALICHLPHRSQIHKIKVGFNMKVLKTSISLVIALSMVGATWFTPLAFAEPKASTNMPKVKHSKVFGPSRPIDDPTFCYGENDLGQCVLFFGSANSCNNIKPCIVGISTYYYPPTSPDDDTWTTVDASSLGWDTGAFNDAVSYAAEQNSTALIILHKGKIVSENYWSDNFGDWNLHTSRRIFSAHKTIAGLVFGIAQDEGLVTRNDFVSDALDDSDGWSTATAAQEALVQIRHLQTMTSGMSDTLAGAINYETEPDNNWRYNTTAYRLIRNIIGIQNPDGDYDQFIQTRLYDRIGMNDSITTEGTSRNSARDMARFGLMMLGSGTWDGVDIIEDKDYLTEMSIPSQGFNEAYGNLTWINGQGSYMTPGDEDEAVHDGELIPAAPADLFAALGRHDKKIYMVPSLDLVIVRHGPAANDGGGLGPSGFDNALWKRLCMAMNDCQPDTPRLRNKL
jgi:CubicO group peptidase (beta-lactamase class C family)